MSCRTPSPPGSRALLLGALLPMVVGFLPALLGREAVVRSSVYVAVPPEQLADVGTLTPLEGILVLGRVRAGVAAFTGSPIVDLVELERIR